MKKLAFVLVLTALVVGASRADEPKPMFRTQPVKTGSFDVVLQMPGTLEPEEVVDVNSAIAGRIVELGKDPQDNSKSFAIGMSVKKGTVLAVLDDSVQRAALDKARAALAVAEAELKVRDAQLAIAEREYQRIRTLIQQKAISAQEASAAQGRLELGRLELDQKKAAVKAAQATVAEAEVNLSATKILSPIDGVILDRRVNIGQAVNPAVNAPPLFLLAKDLHHLKVLATVPEVDSQRLKTGQEATFHVDLLPGTTFKGTVEKIRLVPKKQNAATGTAAIEISVANADDKLLPYMTARMRLKVGRKENVLLIPNAALRFRPLAHAVAADFREDYRDRERLEQMAALLNRPLRRGENAVVWIEDKDGLKPVRVRLGGTNGRVTEVVSGDLKEGTAVVVGE